MRKASDRSDARKRQNQKAYSYVSALDEVEGSEIVREFGVDYLKSIKAELKIFFRRFL